MCYYQSQAGKLRFAALRYFNACGAGDDGTRGEDHRPESHLIPLIIQAAMGRRPDIKIYGADYPTPDGTCIRDYIHIDDLCRAHLLALQKLDECAELAYNLGNGQGYSVRQVIDTVKPSRPRFQGCRGPTPPGRPAGLEHPMLQRQRTSSAGSRKSRSWSDGRHRLEMAYRTPERV
jgi:UDP-glucose 4-epimerase